MFLQGLVSRLLFNVFVSDSILSEFASDMKLSDMVNMLEGRNATREILTGLRVHVKLLKLHKAKCNVMHLSWGSPKHEYRLDDEWIKNSPKKGLRLLVGGKTQQKLVRCAFSPESQLYSGVRPKKCG